MIDFEKTLSWDAFYSSFVLYLENDIIPIEFESM